MIDETSLKILKILQEKARIPNVEVARQVGLVPSAVLERIRKLEKQGYIDGYEVRLNPKRFKRSLVAFIHVTIDPAVDYDEIAENLLGNDGIQEIHQVAGDDGFLLKVRVADTGELGRLLSEQIGDITGIKATRTMIVMSTQKETARIPIDDDDLLGD
jgi:Lrp/AsnC family leucine-responsive transcriptional regulator